jgi:hypothetical protein
MEKSMTTATSSPASITDETVALIRQAQAEVTRAGITTATGLQGYQLEAPAKVIVPIITPLRNLFPRKKGTGNPIAHWKAITSFDSARSVGVVTEGALPSQVTYQTADMQNSYKTIALYNSVTFDEQWTGRSLEGDVRGRRVGELLYQLMTREELWLLNASQYLMVPPRPLVTTTTTGGNALDSTTYYVVVTAENATGETTMSSATAITTGASGGNTNTLNITIFTVPFARNYNVYIGTTNAIGSLWKQASVSGVTYAPQPAYNASVTLTGGGTTTSGEIQGPTVGPLALTAAIAGSGSNPPATNGAKSFVDGSGNILMFDGVISQGLSNATTANGLTLGAQIAVPASTNGQLALTDIQGLLMNMYNQAAGDPDYLVVHPIVANKITNLTIAAGQTRYIVEASQPEQSGKLVSQYRVTHFLNQATGKEIPIITDRYCPADTVVALPFSIPFPTNDITTAIEVETNREYWGIDYAITDSSYKFGDYVNECCKVYFLGGLGILRGITPSV